MRTGRVHFFGLNYLKILLFTFRQLKAVRFAPEVFGIKHVGQIFIAIKDNEAHVSSVRPSSEQIDGLWVVMCMYT